MCSSDLVAWDGFSLFSADERSLAGTGQVAGASLAWCCSTIGTIRLRQSRISAYRWFKRSVLAMIFFAQVFLFIQSQALALAGLAANLGLVVAALLLSERLGRLLGAQGLRALGVATSVAGSSGSIRVRETVRLPMAGSRGSASLHLVEVGERLLLIGASEGSVSLVTEFEQDEVEALPGAGTPRGPGAMGRAEARRAASTDGQEPARPVPTDDGAVLASVLRRLSDSGRRLRGDE